MYNYMGGGNTVAANYQTSSVIYTNGSAPSGSNAGVIVPNGSGGSIWVNNYGCVPSPMVVLDETSEVQVALHDAIDTNQDMSIISSKIGKLASKKDVGSLFTTGRKQLCVDETESFQNERLALLQEAFESTSPLPMEAIRVCLSTV